MNLCPCYDALYYATQLMHLCVCVTLETLANDRTNVIGIQEAYNSSHLSRLISIDSVHIQDWPTSCSVGS